MANKINYLKTPLAFFIFASIYFFLLGFETISKNVINEVSLVVFAYFCIVLIIQILILKIVSSRLHRAISNLIIGLVLGINLITFYISFFSKFLSLNIFPTGLLMALLGILAIAIYSLAYSFDKFRLVLIFILVVNSLVIGASILKYKTANQRLKITNQNQNFGKFQNIKLENRPNIHLLGFDSMIPSSIAKRYMDLNELPYDKILKSESFVLRNMFASNVPTRFSLNSIMRLADPSFNGTEFFSGGAESPLSYLLKNNGYKLATGFSNNILGSKGEYIQEFRTLGLSGFIQESVLCKFQGEKEKILQYYGFCHLLPSLLPKDDGAKWYDVAFDAIVEKGKDASPWLTFHHVYDLIGHTDRSHNSQSDASKANYTIYFQEKSQELGRILPDFIKRIKENDPNSIVFIFGDHGTWLSRTVEFDDDPEFFVIDRYGVYGSILKTDNFCSSKKVITHYANPYLTPERVLAGVIRCLSTVPENVDRIVNFAESYSYADYLYE